MNLSILAVAVALATAAPVGGNVPATVHIRNFAFVPATLTVAAGTTVRFVNDDAEAHTVTAAGGTFNSEGIDGGASWSYRFATAGRFDYFCALHPYMRGAVVVAAGARPAGSPL